MKKDVNQFGEKEAFIMESKEENLQKYSNTLESEFAKMKEINMNSKTKSLQKYSKELELDYVLSIEELIESHRNLRIFNITNNTKFRLIAEEYRRKGYEDGYVKAINREFISFKDLQKMNVKEFADYLCDY